MGEQTDEIMKTVLLIDGDIIAYKHAAGGEVATDWGDHCWTLHTDTKQAVQSMDAYINSLVTILEADKIEIALTGTNVFRKRIDKSYKASRQKTRKPIGLGVLREHIMTNLRGSIENELEADDLLGIWATDPMFHAGAKKIIVSIDKDMQTIPCHLWNSNRPEFGVKNISPESANDFHLYQTLVGDSSDGYPGCPTYGPTKSRRLLDKEGSGWPMVVEAFEKQGKTEEEALVQARLARILRIENYNIRTKTIKYWNP
jgi:DNA polymerase-1